MTSSAAGGTLAFSSRNDFGAPCACGLEEVDELEEEEKNGPDERRERQSRRWVMSMSRKLHPFWLKRRLTEATKLGSSVLWGRIVEEMVDVGDADERVGEGYEGGWIRWEYSSVFILIQLNSIIFPTCMLPAMH